MQWRRTRSANRGCACTAEKAEAEKPARGAKQNEGASRAWKDVSPSALPQADLQERHRVNFCEVREATHASSVHAETQYGKIP